MSVIKDESREAVCTDESGADPVEIVYSISFGDYHKLIDIKPDCPFYQPVKGKWFRACSKNRGFIITVGIRCLFDRVLLPKIKREFDQQLKEGEKFPQTILAHVKSFNRKCLRSLRRDGPSREIGREWTPVPERTFDNSSWPNDRGFDRD